MTIAFTALILVISLSFLFYFNAERKKSQIQTDKYKYTLIFVSMIFLSVLCGLYLLVNLLLLAAV